MNKWKCIWKWISFYPERDLIGGDLTRKRHELPEFCKKNGVNCEDDLFSFITRPSKSFCYTSIFTKSRLAIAF